MAVAVTGPSASDLGALLVDDARTTAEKFKCAYELKSLRGKDAVEALVGALLVPQKRRRKMDAMSRRDVSNGSVLLRHEYAYILGQMKNSEACEALEEVLMDLDDDPIIRHEAAEALGAIGASRSESILKEFSQDPAPVVATTCQLALSLYEWRRRDQDDPAAQHNLSSGIYGTVDPAPPLPCDNDIAEAKLAHILMDEKETLFKRYRAMFSLRNKGTKGAVLVLCEALKQNNECNALLKHELCYVLGQLEHEAATSALMSVVEDPHEHEMVRHEAAESLGAIGGPGIDDVLRNFAQNGTVQIVKESCEVALDWNLPYKLAI